MSEELPPTTPTTPITPVTPTTTDPILTGPVKDTSWAAITSAACGGVALLTFLPSCGLSCCISWIPFINLIGICCVSLPPLLSVAGIIFGIIGFKSRQGLFAKIGIALSAVCLLANITLWILGLVGVVASSIR